MSTTVFEQTTAVTSGPYTGDYLWSDPTNWSNGVPTNGDSVITAFVGVDDLASLTLGTLTTAAGGSTYVTGQVLSVGTLSLAGGTLSADSDLGGSPVTVVVDNVVDSGGTLAAQGASSVLYDLAPTDAGENFLAADGGEIVVSSNPSAASNFVYSNGDLAFGVAPGTISSAITSRLAVVGTL